MPKYDVAKVTAALRLVQEGKLTREEIARKVGIGSSTIERHVSEYHAGNPPDIDIGPLPEPRVTVARKARAEADSGGASLQAILAEQIRLRREEAARLREGAKRADALDAEVAILEETARRLA